MPPKPKDRKRAKDDVPPRGDEPPAKVSRSDRGIQPGHSIPKELHFPITGELTPEMVDHVRVWRKTQRLYGNPLSLKFNIAESNLCCNFMP